MAMVAGPIYLVASAVGKGSELQSRLVTHLQDRAGGAVTTASYILPFAEHPSDSMKLREAQWGLESRRNGTALISKAVFDAGGREKPKRLKGATEGSLTTARLITSADGDVTTARLITSADGDVWLDIYDQIAHSGGDQSSHALWRVTNIATGEHRVMKCYLKFDDEDLISELRATRDLTPHPNIMRFDKVIETDDEAFVLCEFLDGQDLMSFYEQGVDEATAKHLFHQIFSAFAHLHGQCGVLHNDVKLENLFVVGTGGTTAQLQAKIIDFGLASFPGKKPKVANPGTCALAYCAPELLDEAQQRLLPVLPHATKEMDMFRLGVVLYVLLLRQFPYPPIRPPDTSQPARPLKDDSFTNESHTVTLGNGRALSPECKELLGKLLAFDPKARLTAQAALQHGWFHT